jgi:hypothetical protein
VKKLAETYTKNQTGVIAIALAISLKALTAMGVVHMGLGPITVLPPMLVYFWILNIIGWILIVPYIKLVRPAFIIGIVLVIITMITLIVSPGVTPWYTFSAPVWDISVLVGYYLFGLAFIYFAYKSYQELKK